MKEVVSSQRKGMTNWLIRKLGGYDPVAVKLLVFNSGQLTNMLRINTVQSKVNKQIANVKLSILGVDPIYGILRGYHKELERKRECSVRAVEERSRGREGEVYAGIAQTAEKACVRGVLDKA